MTIEEVPIQSKKVGVYASVVWWDIRLMFCVQGDDGNDRSDGCGSRLSLHISISDV